MTMLPLRRCFGRLVTAVGLGIGSVIGLALSASVVHGQESPPVAGSSDVGGASQRKAPKTTTDFRLEADRVLFDRDNDVLRAVGSVVLVYGDKTLKTETLVYEQAINKVKTVGKAVLEQPGVPPLNVESLELDTTINEVVGKGLSVLLGEGVLLEGKTAIVSREGKIILHGAISSPCEACPKTQQRLWQLAASEVHYDPDNPRVRYVSPRLEVLGGIPILFAPSLSLPRPDLDRLAGVLQPAYGWSNELRYWAEIPLLFTPDAHTNFFFRPRFNQEHDLLLLSEATARSSYGDTHIRFDTISENLLDDGSNDFPDQRFRWSLDAKGDYEITPYWRGGFVLGLASDRLFALRYGLSAISDVTRTLYLQGSRRQSRFSAEIRGGRRLYATGDDAQSTLAMPQIDYSTQWRWGAGKGALDFELNLLNLSRSDKSGKTRLATRTQWQETYATSIGMTVTPSVGMRADIYAQSAAPTADTGTAPDDESAGLASGLMRLAPWVSTSLALPLGKTNNGVSHRIEPLVQAILRPDAPHADAIVNDDSRAAAFDETNLFAINKFAGWDRWEGASRLNAGVRYSMTADNKYVSALLGQSWHLGGNNPFSGQPNTESSLAHDTSDIIGAVQFVGPAGYLKMRTQLESDSLKPSRFEFGGSVSGSTNDGRLHHTLTTHYGSVIAQPSAGIDTDRKQVNSNYAIKIGENWSAHANIRYDFVASRVISDDYAVGYDDECIGFGLGLKLTRFADPALETVKELTLRLELKTFSESRYVIDAAAS